jgi:beta-lactamase class A
MENRKQLPSGVRKAQSGRRARTSRMLSAAAAVLGVSVLFLSLSMDPPQNASPAATATALPGIPTSAGPGLPPEPTLIDPAEEEKRRAEAARERWIAGLQSLLEEEAAYINGEASVHVRLDEGGEAGVNADLPVDGASVIKVPVMAALYDAWEEGKVKRTAADERRVREMITRSRNTVTNVLIARLGMRRINAWLEEHGYTQTQVRAKILGPMPDGPNTVTAEEMTRMLQELVRGELVSAGASSEMRRLLLDQHWRSRIPAGIPEEATVGNKTGTMNGLLHDVAFVETPAGLRYTIAVLIQRESPDAVRAEAIAWLSQRVYEYLTTTSPGAEPTALPAPVVSTRVPEPLNPSALSVER